MSKSSNELIHRYLVGIATNEETRKLETRLIADDQLQDEFLLQAELDAHLRQEAQTINTVDPSVPYRVERSIANGNPRVLWKWVSGISTLTAAILLTFIILDVQFTRQAMAVPSLGKLLTNVSWTERNIWFAAITGDLPMLKAELQDGVSINERTEEAYTPLQMAALFGQTDAADLLLRLGADLSLTDNEGNTALHMAVFLGRTDVVRALLAHGADPLARNAAGFSSIDCAGAPWSKDYEAHLRQTEEEMQTPLDLNRIRGERLTILKLLVGGDRASELNQRASGPSCMLDAAISGDVQAMQQCLAGDRDLNETEQVAGNTPLMLAATFGNHEAVGLLIRAGADIEVRNKSGGTALHQACFFAQPEIVELLLDAHADPTKENAYGVTPLELAPEQLDSDWKAVYEHTYQMLNLELDFETITESHAQIRESFLQRFNKTGAGK
jgi:ankyrin repeat protein